MGTIRRFIHRILGAIPGHWFFYKWVTPYTKFYNWLWKPEVDEYKDAADAVLSRLKKEGPSHGGSFGGFGGMQ